MSPLADVLSQLRTASRTPFGDQLVVPVNAEKELARLHKEVARLAESNKPNRKPAPGVLEAAKAHWLAAGGQAELLSAREIRALCGDQESAVDSHFIQALSHHPDLGGQRRWIEGLIAAYLDRWGQMQDQPALESLLRKLVRGFTGRSPRIARCRSAADELFSPGAAKWLGKLAVERRAKVSKVLDEWDIGQAGQLALHAAAASVEAWVSHFGRVKRASVGSGALDELKFLTEVILAPSTLPPERVGQAASAFILWERVGEDSQLLEALRTALLHESRLGDPRLPRNKPNWLACSAEARNRAIGFFSRYDLEFFFGVVAFGKDPHGRRDFWLRYINQVVDSRVVLCQEDASRARTSAKEKPVYSRVTGTRDVSAFLMQFSGAPFIFVEFSRPGNALYLHDATRFAAQIGSIHKNPLDLSVHLKCLATTATRVVHREGWQVEVRARLAQHGIRP